MARRALDEVALAERTFGPAESKRLAELDPPARKREFLRLWVRHEAEVKCRGTGFAGKDAADTSERELWIAELQVGVRAAAAVALSEAPRELCCWDWRS